MVVIHQRPQHAAKISLVIGFEMVSFLSEPKAFSAPWQRCNGLEQRLTALSV
jgi:hypothetical protein